MPSITYLVDRCVGPFTRGTWVTCWAPGDQRGKCVARDEEEGGSGNGLLAARVAELNHIDFRDRIPPSLAEVVEVYAAYVREDVGGAGGAWTFGLFEMWSGKAKFVKHAVHIPCWTSFRWLPWRWRGWCLGKSWNQCLWTGWRQMRWSRAAYSGALGREYVMPILDVGRHGFLSDIRALCGLSFAMACVFSCGIGQVLSLCGNVCSNFAAVYTCNARRKVRQRYGLPPAIPCCVDGVDDCLVDFFCFYCASHQLLRELAVRGVDGPGMHVFDVVTDPATWSHLEGIEEAMARRRWIVERMTARRPTFFDTTRPKPKGKPRQMMQELDEAFVASAFNTTEALKNAILMGLGSGTSREENCRALGWNCRFAAMDATDAPAQMSMHRLDRTSSDVVSGWSELSKKEVLWLLGDTEESGLLDDDYRWSVAY